MNEPRNNAVDLFRGRRTTGERAQPGSGETVGRMVKYAHEHPLTIIDPNDDPQFIQAIRHTMLPDENLMEWIARNGISRAQALAATPQELTARVKQATENAASEEIATSSWRPKTNVPKFIQV